MSSPFWKQLFTVSVATATLFSTSFMQGQAEPAGSTPLKIGFSIDSLSVERWQIDVNAFEDRARELGAEVTTVNAQGDDALQLKQAQKLIASGIKVLVLIPHNTSTAAQIVAAAKAKNVRVISYDRMIRNSDVDLYVGFDSYLVGKMQAEYLVQRAPKGNYVLIAGSPADGNARSLRAGQMEVLKPYIDRGDIKIVSDTWATDWDATVAYRFMADAIESNKGEIAAVVASNDGTAGGAVQALAEHDLAGKVLVSGQDADLAAIVRIMAGTQAMTVYKPFAAEAGIAAEAAVKMAKGEAVETATSIENGSKKVPAILLASIAVDGGNVQATVIKDGFQDMNIVKQGLGE